MHVSEVDEGTAVSYGGTWVAPRRTRIGTVPVGYGDGYFRALSGRTDVLVGDRRVPQVGRVCMDQMVVDLGPGSDEQEGAPVVLIGSAGDETISADDIADRAGTIAYEVLTNISARVPRVYRDGCAGRGLTLFCRRLAPLSRRPRSRPARRASTPPP